MKPIPRSLRADRRALLEIGHLIVDARDSEELPALIYELEKLIHEIEEDTPVSMKGPDYERHRVQAERAAIRELEKGRPEFSVSVRYLLRRDRERVRNFIHARVRKMNKRAQIRWKQEDNRLYVTIIEKESDG